MTKYKDIKDEDLVELFKYKYAYHTSEAKKYKMFLDMYNSAFSDQDSEIVTTIESVSETVDKGVNDNRILHRPERKQTFEEIIIEILNGGKPMTSKMLLEKYLTLGHKEVTLKDFSSKLSMRSKAGHIKNVKFNEYPPDQRFWWGMAEWFDGNSLKDEYFTKVHNQMNSNK